MEFDDLVGTTSPPFTLLWLLFSGSDHAAEVSQKPEEVVPFVEGDEGGETDEEEDVTWEEEEEEEWKELVPGYDKESSKAFAPCPLFLRRQRTTGL
mmetsp:Transcript_20626/g.29001  ORF Transcript_20626/g.29001 Transcript_20626/m.29001 type:complete len:96 (-) Transcript_20626:1682-1969(-)